MTTEEKKNELPIYEYGVIIASDSRSKGLKEDSCLEVFKENMPSFYKLSAYKIVEDDIGKIQETILDFSDNRKLPLIMTSGGTGFSERDVSPEATLPLLEKQTPGISEAIRLSSKEETDMWMLSRAVSGIRKSSLIINMPGSPKAVNTALKAILPALKHGLDILLGNFTQHE